MCFFSSTDSTLRILDQQTAFSFFFQRHFTLLIHRNLIKTSCYHTSTMKDEFCFLSSFNVRSSAYKLKVTKASSIPPTNYRYYITIIIMIIVIFQLTIHHQTIQKALVVYPPLTRPTL